MTSSTIVTVAMVIAVTAVVLAVVSLSHRRQLSPELRGRHSIPDLSVERDSRLWTAGSIGITGTGAHFGYGAGSAGGGCADGCGG